MRAFGRTLLMAFFVATVPLSGCFGKEEAAVEDVDEFDEFGGYSVVAPIDTGGKFFSFESHAPCACTFLAYSAREDKLDAVREFLLK